MPSPASYATPDLIEDLCGASHALTKFSGSGKAYDPLINALQKRQATAYPTAKELRLACGGISPAKLNRWLNELYQDFLAAISADGDFLHFHPLPSCLVVSGPKGFTSFRTLLPSIPQIGQRISLDFLYAAIGSREFFVSSVLSEFEQGQLTTYVYLQAGYPNSFREHLLERARFEGELPDEEEQAMSEAEIDDLLRQLYNKYPPVR